MLVQFNNNGKVVYRRQFDLHPATLRGMVFVWFGCYFGLMSRIFIPGSWDIPRTALCSSVWFAVVATLVVALTPHCEKFQLSDRVFFCASSWPLLWTIWRSTQMESDAERVAVASVLCVAGVVILLFVPMGGSERPPHHRVHGMVEEGSREAEGQQESK